MDDEITAKLNPGNDRVEIPLYPPFRKGGIKGDFLVAKFPNVVFEPPPISDEDTGELTILIICFRLRVNLGHRRWSDINLIGV